MPRLLLGLCALLALGACQTATDAPLDDSPSAQATEETDAAYETTADSALAAVGGEIDPSRVVVLGGPIAETVYALGLGDNVVAADQSALHPASLLEKPRLNYFRQTSAEGVLSQEPTVVLASDGTGPPDVIEQIQTTGVSVVTVPTPETVAGAFGRVRMLGRALGREAAADSLVETMRAELAEAATFQPETAPRVLFVYARGAGLVQVIGAGTTADLVLELAGAENAVDIEGTAPLTAEAVVAAAPDVVVIPTRGLESIGGPDGLFAQPGLAQTPAGEARRVVAVDDALLLGLGPRLGQAVQELARGLSTPTETASR
ncbi:MAG: ABC transporter substrate-binding protein [Bacteroidota bacterium]